ncbi:MAG: LytR/AlgR family response regulator transcription factor [Flavobacteriaceae bacterium]
MKLNVIVIDDSPVQLLVTSKLIQRNKHLNLIAVYANPSVGLLAANSSEVDIVILDVEMPDIDGFSLMKLFDGHIKVIMNSTKASFESRAFAAGAVDFLPKPLNDLSLESSISKLLMMEKYANTRGILTALAS